MPYEKLLDECSDCDVWVCERKLLNHGLYSNSVIAINSNIETTAEKACVLAEELGHHHASCGDIIKQDNVTNIKQENFGRAWAYERLVPLSQFIHAYRARVANRYELAEYLGVTEPFIDEAIKYYKRKHGLMYTQGNYIIAFEPFGVFETFGF